jgi:hypothetical protein
MFREKAYYMNLVELMLDTTRRTALGQGNK